MRRRLDHSSHGASEQDAGFDEGAGVIGALAELAEAKARGEALGFDIGHLATDEEDPELVGGRQGQGPTLAAGPEEQVGRAPCAAVPVVLMNSPRAPSAKAGVSEYLAITPKPMVEA